MHVQASASTEAGGMLQTIHLPLPRFAPGWQWVLVRISTPRVHHIFLGGPRGPRGPGPRGPGPGPQPSVVGRSGVGVAKPKKTVRKSLKKRLEKERAPRPVQPGPCPPSPPTTPTPPTHHLWLSKTCCQWPCQLIDHYCMQFMS